MLLYVITNQPLPEKTKSSFLTAAQNCICYILFTLFLPIMETGKITRLTDRGFGFISREGAEKDLFFHAKELVDVEYNDLQEGDMVTFVVVDGPKGPAASEIRRA